MAVARSAQRLEAHPAQYRAVDLHTAEAAQAPEIAQHPAAFAALEVVDPARVFDAYPGRKSGGALKSGSGKKSEGKSQGSQPPLSFDDERRPGGRTSAEFLGIPGRDTTPLHFEIFIKAFRDAIESRRGWELHSASKHCPLTYQAVSRTIASSCSAGSRRQTRSGNCIEARGVVRRVSPRSLGAQDRK